MKKLAACLLVVTLSFVSAQSGRIAFTTLDSSLATINPDGSDARILSDGVRRYQFPAWSPDGRQIAALSSSLNGGAVELFNDTESSGDAPPVEVYFDERQVPFYLYWSPDSARVSLLANHPEGIGLHIAQSGADSYLLATGSPFYWQWTEDASRLFIHSSTGNLSRIGFTGANEDTLTDNLANFGYFQAPGISKGGDYVAYATGILTEGNLRVVVESADGSGAVKREVQHEGVAAFSWSPTRDELALMNPVEARPRFYGPLRLLDAGTGLLEPLTTNTAFAFFWSPDGTKIAYFSTSAGGSDEFANLDNTELSSVTTVAQQNVQNRLFLDLYVIDVETRSERLVSSFVPTPQFVQQFLPFFDQYALSHRIWSPDSDALVLPVVTDNLPQVAVFDLDGNVTPIAPGDMPFWQP